MALKIRGTDGNAILNALTHCDTLEVYGSLYGFLPPPTCESDQVGQLILSFDLTAATWGTAADGRLSLTGLPISATATGIDFPYTYGGVFTGAAVPLYFRAFASGVVKMQGTCGDQASGADMQFPMHWIRSGADISLSEILFIEVNNDA